MVNFTLKNIPEYLHLKLKEMARHNRRSLNNEILARLEANLQTNSPPASDILTKARSLRQKMSVHLTQQKLAEFKTKGRT